ncbi:hypothetical protein GGR50DRAFT_605109 [Xylaria sp. CBS 124048]|nr:hypothetical protein GGR50DRAFT_605109 [Xylaria sp. CBS 124048]
MHHRRGVVVWVTTPRQYDCAALRCTYCKREFKRPAQPFARYSHAASQQLHTSIEAVSNISNGAVSPSRWKDNCLVYQPLQYNTSEIIKTVASVNDFYASNGQKKRRKKKKKTLPIYLPTYLPTLPPHLQLSQIAALSSVPLHCRILSITLQAMICPLQVSWQCMSLRFKMLDCTTCQVQAGSEHLSMEMWLNLSMCPSPISPFTYLDTCTSTIPL